ncbi:hypothetical protein MPTK1_1g12390 [Marchantia polymorpha subsp. ruderalis]|uniref:Uncharacterized protein n=2 Tax=Marchantia polymorpha TaxID=3197 RepID=A0AAF6APD0_MARPO|nr:hypothetical protein MARPO_0019s0009 [Marchantia polymorpha]BBM98300.1 hypothetical protein Mp_1g12390 [Marchantia polymorpha subsp. ruderalis]|eukprot:PTQ44567.1 hypothetical protein MARPO_0019s0009 [Marchantia polymorpha]
MTYVAGMRKVLATWPVVLLCTRPPPPPPPLPLFHSRHWRMTLKDLPQRTQRRALLHICTCRSGNHLLPVRFLAESYQLDGDEPSRCIGGREGSSR